MALVTAVALVFGAFAGSAGAKKLSKSQKAHIRASLRKQVKKNPGAVKRRAFLRGRRLSTSSCRSPFVCATRARRRTGRTPARSVEREHEPAAVDAQPELGVAGTALNQRSIPSALVNFGPSLGSRQFALGGALAAVVDFQDTYDGGALGNVNIKILPGNKTLTTSSVPLLWNDDISDPNTSVAG